MKLLLATKNPDKVREIRHALAGLPVALLSATDMPELPEVVEDAQTLEGNAVKKAETLFRLTGIPSVADDTGLEVLALGGAPGVFSSRYAGPDASYADNVAKLLQALESIPPERRQAQFRTIIAFADAKGAVTMVGLCRGRIILAPRGSQGFGYDPVFQPEGSDRTFAEMSIEEKNRISHRARALQRLRRFLQERLESPSSDG